MSNSQNNIGGFIQEIFLLKENVANLGKLTNKHDLVMVHTIEKIKILQLLPL